VNRMRTEEAPSPTPWPQLSQRRQAMLFAAAGITILLAHIASLVARRSRHAGDFDLAREFGRRFLAGEDLYAGGLHYPYMPSAALYFSPLTLLGPALGLALRYGVALLALALTLRWLEQMVRPHHPGVTTQRWSILALTLGLALHYLVRDLDDGGPHLILLAVQTGGLFAAWRGRSALGGICLGLAAAIKAPAALFLPFFLWQRHHRLAAYMLGAMLAWMAAPALWMGAEGWWAHQRRWLSTVTASVAGTPVPGAAENECRVQNQALRPALLRYLAPSTQDPPHPLGHTGDLLPPVTASLVATASVLGLLLACAAAVRAGAASPWELQCSVVLLLSVLAAPLAWVQHLVVVVPALYLIAVQLRVAGGSGRTATGALLVYAALSLLLNREIIGHSAYLWLLAAGLHTLCLLLLLGILVFARPAARAAAD
jgi:alpha-1,2-mannosyltransferase